MEDISGKQLGAYQIVAPLGEGGMAAVYKAHHAATERYVALKILPRHFASDPNFVTRFKQEAKVLAQLQHPHILPVFDFGEAEGYTYLVMPYIKGGTLTDLLKGQPLSLANIRRITLQIGGALDYAHARGLVHRDVKPSNVLIDETGNCLLSDFGLAKILEGNATITTSGAVMGTPVYMSPEQGMGQKVDRRTDIYSLGVILFEMAVGSPPYKADTPMAVMIKHISDPLPVPSSLVEGFPESLESVILKSLAKNPDDRYQTAGAVVQALQTAIDSVGTAFTPSPIASVTINTTPTQPKTTLAPTIAASSTTPKSSLLKWALPLLGIFLVIVAIIGSMLFFSGTAASPAPTTTSVPAATQVVIPTNTSTPVPTTTNVPPTVTLTATRLATTTPLPPTATAVPPTNLPTKASETASANWAIDFTYRFPDRFWSVGQHNYVIVSACPNALQDSNKTYTQWFSVSDKAAMLSGDVFLRLSGLRHSSGAISEINPAQSTVGALSQIELTRAEADLAVQCKVTISWDGGASNLMTPSPLYQR